MSDKIYSLFDKILLILLKYKFLNLTQGLQVSYDKEKIEENREDKFIKERLEDIITTHKKNGILGSRECVEQSIEDVKYLAKRQGDEQWKSTDIDTQIELITSFIQFKKYLNEAEIEKVLIEEIKGEEEEEEENKSLKRMKLIKLEETISQYHSCIT